MKKLIVSFVIGLLLFTRTINVFAYNIENIEKSVNTTKNAYYIPTNIVKLLLKDVNKYVNISNRIDAFLQKKEISKKNNKIIIYLLDIKGFILQQRVKYLLGELKNVQKNNNLELNKKNTKITELEKTNLALQIDIINLQKELDKKNITNTEYNKQLNTNNNSTTNTNNNPITDEFSVCYEGCDYNTKYKPLNEIITFLQENKYNGKLTIKIRKGIYILTNHIRIIKKNVSIVGDGIDNTKIVGPKGDDVIAWKADYGLLKNVTIDTNINNSASGISAGGVNYLILDSIKVIGNSLGGGFAVYFAGPNHNSSSEYTSPNSAYYHYYNDKLDVGNKLINSTIIGYEESDTVVFALNENSEIKNNHIKGLLSYFMSKNGNISNNVFNGGLGTAIFLSIPVQDVTITNNVIKNIKGTGIRSAIQVENKVPNDVKANNIQIYSNTIENTNYFGMDLSYLENSHIYQNSIKNSGAGGIYMIDVKSSKINNNVILNPSSIYTTGGYTTVWGAGIGVELLKDIDISGNTITDENNKMNYGIFIEGKENKNFIIDSNNISGYKEKDIFIRK